MPPILVPYVSTTFLLFPFGANSRTLSNGFATTNCLREPNLELFISHNARLLKAEALSYSR